MKKMFIFFFLFIVVTCQKQCTCAQLLSKVDCERMIDLKCAWYFDSCQDAKSYCDRLTTKDECHSNQCAWVSGRCTIFTGCSPFPKKNKADCQEISKKCISDGNHCVEIARCPEYKTEASCKIDSNKLYCYWDSSKCTYPDSCDKLLSDLSTDQLCRDQNSSCTTTGSGCIKSGENCSDQSKRESCVWNLEKTMKCLWDGEKCVDYICENAPLSTNAEQCNSFPTSKSDEKCVGKKWGGCYQSNFCAQSLNEENCIMDKNSQPCIWKYENAQCLEKICTNAPTWYNSLDLCNTFLNTCTVNSTQAGCQTKTCDNAPITFSTNLQCENYFPNNNCINKQGGGCITNSTCEAINIEESCIQDVNGAACYWNQEKRACFLKTCLNAPNLTSHQQCQGYQSTCTVNSKLSGCVDMTCANLLTKEFCLKDLNNKQCQFVGACYKKQCAIAPLTLTSHDECQIYLSSCTVASTGEGCTEIPQACEANLTEGSCYLKTVNNKFQKCLWIASKCTDLQCIDLNNQLSTSQDCDAALEGCVVNNQLQGCIKLPEDCHIRLNSDNCQIARDNYPICLWHNDQCIEKNCQNAKYFIDDFSPVTCSAYLQKCTIDETGVNCMDARQCSQYKFQQCVFDSNQNQCEWDYAQQICFDAGCEHAPKNGTYTTDSSCQSFKVNGRVCTVIKDDGCKEREEKCSSYCPQQLHLLK